MSNDKKEAVLSIADRLALNNPNAPTQEEMDAQATVDHGAAATLATANVGVEGEVVIDTIELKPGKGEVLFEAIHESALVRTAMDGGREIALPFVTSNEKEIAWLRAFAEHTQMVKITEGV